MQFKDDLYGALKTNGLARWSSGNQEKLGI